ncbi:MAG: acyltransferase family protein, partial [Candidatus Kapaibacterium sp.]
PGLNTGRFIAAMLVLIAHGEAIRAHQGLPNMLHWSIFHNGSIAVSFFFVLSGFLITHVLLQEKERCGTVAVGWFYQRRSLRILPLYFLLVILGTVAIPSLLPLLGIGYVIPYDPMSVVGWYLAMMPFVVNIHYDVFVIGPLWSIGVEEWYYLCIAPVIKRVSHRLHIAFGLVIVTKLALLVLVDNDAITGPVAGLITLLSFEHMAAGGLIALMFRRRPAAASPRHGARTALSIIVLAFLILRVTADAAIKEMIPLYARICQSYAWTSVLDMILFAWSIHELVRRPKRLNGTVMRLLERGGEYSYGIYMYHNLVAFALTFGLRTTWVQLSLPSAMLLYHLALGIITLSIAVLSRHSFEAFFLRKQRRPSPQ